MWKMSYNFRRQKYISVSKLKCIFSCLSLFQINNWVFAETWFTGICFYGFMIKIQVLTYWDDHCDWLDNQSKGARSGGRGLVDVTPLQKGWKTLWDPEASSQTVPLKIVGIYTKITGDYFPNNLSGLNLVIGGVLHKHRQENIMSPTILSNSEAVYLGSFSDALFNT